jgi:hypothetical protein
MRASGLRAALEALTLHRITGFAGLSGFLTINRESFAILSIQQIL